MKLDNTITAVCTSPVVHLQVGVMLLLTKANTDQYGIQTCMVLSMQVIIFESGSLSHN